MAFWLLTFHVCVVLSILPCFVPVSCNAPQKQLSPELDFDVPQISFSPRWESLGPFRVGTREAVWGADPLEAHGGFRYLGYDANKTFHSSLTKNASISWRIDEYETNADENGAVVDLCLDYDNVDWGFLQNIYGWAALQYQSWTRGELWSSASTKLTITFSPTNILEFWFNEHHIFGGDFFGFERAPVILDLKPGRNVINVRLVRDVRANGGQIPPVVTAKLSAKILRDSVRIIPNSLVLPDVIRGRFASSQASITVCNAADERTTVHSITTDVAGKQANTLGSTVRVQSGQCKPLKFSINSLSTVLSHNKATLQYNIGSQEEIHEVHFDIPIVRRRIHSAHKITFEHPGGSLSYAILQPPSPNVSCQDHEKLPVLLNLHGAGLQADNHQVRHMLDAAPDLHAWTLFPTGMSPWSGDDWHTWGFADIQAAIGSIPSWIGANEWAGCGVNLDRYIVSGHSNGGQGTWFMALHQPDRIIAAAAASAYSSVENYVPFVMWAEACPFQTAILQTARSSFRHELLVENIEHTPMLVQHGEDDDNVPAYHSRLMASLASQAGFHIEYVELPHKGHWFEGAMTTDPMLKFYEKYLASEAGLPNVPDSFSFSVASSDDFGSRFGIGVDQLHSPDKLGRVDVEKYTDANITLWRVKTSNIRRLRFDISCPITNVPDAIQLDHTNPAFLVNGFPTVVSFVATATGKWIQPVGNRWQTLDQRFGRQRGSMDAIMRTRGAFQIVFCSTAAYSTAVEISRNLLQYFGADSELMSLSDYQHALLRGGNVITVVLGGRVPSPQLSNFPISLEHEKLYVRSRVHGMQMLDILGGMGGSWLRPLPDERLELVVWGADDAGLRQAARMVPTLTGAGQPDFVILGEQARWKGASGVLAMGFFDYEWKISSGAYLP